MSNLFKRFQALIPTYPLRVGDVITYADGVATIQEQGGVATARGDATIGDRGSSATAQSRAPRRT